MKYIFAALLFVFVFNSTSSVAQEQTIDKVPGFITFDDQLIKAALDSIFFIVRQDYVLRTVSANPKEFGRGGHEYFGRFYSLAILSDNKLWVDGKLKTPWLYDENFRDYQGIDTLVPVLTNTYIRRLNESVYTKPELLLKDTNKADIFYYSLKNPQRGVPMIPGIKDSLGWLVVAYTKEDIAANDTCNVFLFPFRPKPQFKNANTAAIKMPARENIIGGGYFGVNITVGVIRFNFTGMLFKKGNAWMTSVLPAIKSENPSLNEIKKEGEDGQKTNKKGKK